MHSVHAPPDSPQTCCCTRSQQIAVSNQSYQSCAHGRMHTTHQSLVAPPVPRHVRRILRITLPSLALTAATFAYAWRQSFVRPLSSPCCTACTMCDCQLIRWKMIDNTCVRLIDPSLSVANVQSVVFMGFVHESVYWSPLLSARPQLRRATRRSADRATRHRSCELCAQNAVVVQLGLGSRIRYYGHVATD
jgi:hypothetical protein